MNIDNFTKYHNRTGEYNMQPISLSKRIIKISDLIISHPYHTFKAIPQTTFYQ